MPRKPTAPQIHALLLKQQVRRAVRAARSPGQRIVTVMMALFGAYMGFTLIVLGLYFPIFARQMAAGTDPVELVNRQALSVLFGLFAMRFLFQKTPKLQLQPYLHLPIARTHLVAFFALASVVSVHNLFPLLFTIPFALTYLAPEFGQRAAWTWIVGSLALLLASNFANLYLRTLLHRREGLFLSVLGGFALVGLIDEYSGAHLIRSISSGLFTSLLRADLATVLSFVLFVASTAIFAGAALLESVRTQSVENAPPRRAGRLHELAERWDVSGHLVWLELRLMWRNRRPRHYLLVSLLFSTIYLVLLLASPRMFGDFIFAAVIGLFASGGFALNYGQLMFGWDSTYYDGLLGRNIRTRAITRSKIIVLQASCLVLFVLSLPLFLWMRPDLVPLHVAFLFYNAGVTSQLVMELAVRNHDRVDLGRTGGFFNYEGFSARHWLWFIPTALPPTLLMVALRHRPELAWTVLAVAGLVSLAATEFWVKRHSTLLDRSKYRMAAGFRRES